MRIGIAETDVRTPLGMQLTGYGGRATGAIDIHDQLKMSAVYMESKGVKSILIVCQILGFDPDFSKITEVKISQALNIPVSNIILHSIHTHAGPASGTLYGCGIADRTWLEETQRDLIQLAKDACSQPFEGYFDYWTGECDIGMNRVARLYKELPYQDMIDKEVGVIRILETGTDRLKAVIVNHGCHPVTLDSRNYTYTADFPYFTINKLEKTYGKDVPVIFTQGCCGDIDPKERFTFEATQKNGEKLADSVLTSKFEFKNTDADIKCYAAEITVPLVPDHTKEGFQKVKEEALAECNKIIDAKYAPHFANLQMEAVKVVWADLCIKGYESGDLMTRFHPVIKTWKVGDLTVVAMPFEIFHELGLHIKDLFGKGKTLVFGYSNGVYGYLPWGDLYDKSIYEAKTSHRYYGYPGPVAKESGDIIYDYLKEIK